MINFQTISFKGLNNTLQSLQANTQVQSNQVNSLERSPMIDSVSFSGKRNKPLEDKIYDVEELEVVEAEPYIVSDDDVEVLDVEPDNYPEIIALDDQMRRKKEEQEELEQEQEKDALELITDIAELERERARERQSERMGEEGRVCMCDSFTGTILQREIAERTSKTQVKTEQTRE